MAVFSRRARSRQAKVAAASRINHLDTAGSHASWADLAKPLLWIPAWAVVGYAAYVNARAAAGTDYLVLGLALDLFGPLMIAAMGRAKREGNHGMWSLCFVVAFLTITWSLISAAHTGALGTFGAERSSKHEHGRQVSLQADIKAAETELSRVVPARPTVAIEAEIAAILDDPRSGRCLDLDGPFTRRECPKLGPLRRDLGQAKARDTAAAKLAALKAAAAGQAPVAEVEGYVEFAMRWANRVGIDIEADTVRLTKTVLYIIALEILKTYIIGFMTWYAPRYQNPSPEARSASPDAVGAPEAIQAPSARLARPEAFLWLLEAMRGDGPLPEGLQRRNDGVFGPCQAYAAAWGVSAPTVSRWAQRWNEEGQLNVQIAGGTWIGPRGRRLRVA